ncbi:hypothetical protein ASD58_08570 [Duganella sp. Root1480D1]|nr:hypothetical protein ASD58_08570 [Duganella sp. Root1480D1]
MQNQGTHQQNVARLHEAGLLALPHRHCIPRRNGTLQVRSGHQIHRPVVRAAWIEMQPHRDQLLQHIPVWLHMPAIFLARPAAQGRIFDALVHRDTQVLVHRHQPIHRAGLFKEGALDGDMAGRQQGPQRR